MNGLHQSKHSAWTARRRGGRWSGPHLAPRGRSRPDLWPIAAAVAIGALAASVTVGAGTWPAAAVTVGIAALSAAVIVQHHGLGHRPTPGRSVIGAGLRLGAMFLCVEVTVGQATGRLAEGLELPALALGLVAVCAAGRMHHEQRLRPPASPRHASSPPRPHSGSRRIGLRDARRRDRASRGRSNRGSRFRTDS